MLKRSQIELGTFLYWLDERNFFLLRIDILILTLNIVWSLVWENLTTFDSQGGK